MIPYYIHQYSISTKASESMDSFFKDAGLRVELLTKGKRMTTSLLCKFERGEQEFAISEFPGNCSAIVVHGVQDLFANSEELLLKAIDICRKFCSNYGYGAVMVSLTNDEIVDLICKERSFKVMTSFTNPHSSNVNHFLVLHI